MHKILSIDEEMAKNQGWVKNDTTPGKKKKKKKREKKKNQWWRRRRRRMRRWIRREQGRRRRRNGRYLLGIMCTQPSWTCIERNVLLICGSVHEKSWGQCGYDSHIIFQTCLEMLHIKNVPKLTAIKQRSETALKTIINSWAASLHQASIAKQHWRRSSIHEQLAFIKQASNILPTFRLPRFGWSA